MIGFPALAATSMDQGRLAAYHAFGEPAKGMTELQPIGIYSIPEVSYVGATEVDLTRDSIPYEVGVSRYRELARGQIAGDSYGMLKLLVSTEDLKLLGVHIFGTSATEMVHIGQAVMGCGGTVEKGSSAFLQVLAFYSPDGRHDDIFISQLRDAQRARRDQARARHDQRADLRRQGLRDAHLAASPTAWRS